ncbi:MAG TPA: hypothetical protein VFR21_06730 [Bradyrhizobium sp.]|nr:hypothetical protein [Bradyrhizobium sp.]
MATDLLLAKQTLSSRFLRIGVQRATVGLRRTFVVEAAVAAAGQNVHSVGIGRKVVEGRPTSIMAVRLYVVQKLAPSLIPPRDRLPESINGIPTDVIESSPAFLAVRRVRALSKPGRRADASVSASAAEPACTTNRQKNQRPLVAGISVAHRDVTAGTLGYFCQSRRLGDDPAKIYVLSNNHVLANVNKGLPGDMVLQPGPVDGGTMADEIGQLSRFHQLDLSGNPNKIDAAVAELKANVEWRAEICTIGTISGTQIGHEGMKIRKHGRTTGYTEGTITDESYDTIVGMDHNDPSVSAVFQSQLRIEPTPPHSAIGRGGDSGSLVVTQSGKDAIGLYFAGPPSGNYGVANRIEDVLSEMQIELVTGAATA